MDSALRFGCVKRFRSVIGFSPSSSRVHTRSGITALTKSTAGWLLPLVSGTRRARETHSGTSLFHVSYTGTSVRISARPPKPCGLTKYTGGKKRNGKRRMRLLIFKTMKSVFARLGTQQTTRCHLIKSGTTQSGVGKRPFWSRRVLEYAILPLLLLGGCEKRQPVRTADGPDIMLPQATGVRIGMSVQELRRVRPRLIEDSGETWEAAGNGSSNVYWFSSPRHPTQASRSGESSDLVAAVAMHQTYPESLDRTYLAQIAAIRGQWSRQLGDPQDSAVVRVPDALRGDSTVIGLVVWRSSDLQAVLEYEVGSTPDGRSDQHSRLIRAVVQDRRLPLETPLLSAAVFKRRQETGVD